jgi:hypothetical protein
VPRPPVLPRGSTASKGSLDYGCSHPTPNAAAHPYETIMAKRSRTAVLKRQREAKKAEKAAAKREKRETRSSESGSGEPRVATQEDLQGYGFPVDSDSNESERS